MQVIGAGLGRTGTTSLCRALQILGLRSVHFDIDRLKGVIAGTEPSPNFKVFDDVDATTDVSTAVFFEELCEAYPLAKVVLTTRAESDWWRSYSGLAQRVQHVLDQDSSVRTIVEDVRSIAYGSPAPKEFIYRKKFREHNKRVVDTVPENKLLIMDITKGDGWEKLCPFLGMSTPDHPFPKLNTT